MYIVSVKNLKTDQEIFVSQSSNNDYGFTSDVIISMQEVKEVFNV